MRPRSTFARALLSSGKLVLGLGWAAALLQAAFAATLTVKKTTDPSGGKEFPFKFARVTKWGRSGTGKGEFRVPYGVAVDGVGNVYVVDAANDRIQKFDGNGNYLTEWGGYGFGDGQLIWPRGVAVDSAGNVYVADTGNHRIQKFDSTGNYLAQWGSVGSGDGQLAQPGALALDGAGNIYVADTNNNRIQKFDSTGKYVAKWGVFAPQKNYPSLNFPAGVAVDKAGNNYVADTRSYRVQRFDAIGNYLGEWQRYGRDRSTFGAVSSVAVDEAGNVYVADGSNDRIEKFDANGNHLDRWSIKGPGPGTDSPLAVAVDRFGNVFVAERDNCRIVKFSQQESFVLSDGGSKPFNGLPAATYYVGERTINSWAVSGISYGSGSADLWGDGLEITLANDDVTCTFTNSDTIAPTVTIQQTTVSPTNRNPINFRVIFSEPVTGFDGVNVVTLDGTAGATTATATETAPNDGTTYNVAVGGMTGHGTVIVTVNAGVAKDAAGNLNTAATSPAIIYDLEPTVTIKRAAGQERTTNHSPVNFTVVFSEPVTGFTKDDVSLDGTATRWATAEVTEVAPNDGTTYNVAVSGMTNDGTVRSTIYSGAASDAIGQPTTNTASTSDDNSVIFYGPLTARIYVRMLSPTSAGPLTFGVKFSRPVIDFDMTKVMLDGTAGATTVEVTEVAPNDGTTYNVAVSGMTGYGTVIIKVDAGTVQDALGYINEATTFTATHSARPTVTIDKANGQTDPTSSDPINFTAVFSKRVSFGSLPPSYIASLGTDTGATTVVLTETAPNDGTTYNVAVSGMTNSGSVSVRIVDGSAQDTDGNRNLNSNSVSVTYHKL